MAGKGSNSEVWKAKDILKQEFVSATGNNPKNVDVMIFLYKDILEKIQQ